MEQITILPKNTNWTRQCNPYVSGGAAEAPKIEKKVIKPAVKVEAPKAAAAGDAKGKAVKAPLPGTITSIEVKVGDMVKEGQTLLVLEAMKMQNNIEAECDGKIAEIKVAKGDAVMENAVLVVIEQ